MTLCDFGVNIFTDLKLHPIGLLCDIFKCQGSLDYIQREGSRRHHKKKKKDSTVRIEVEESGNVDMITVLVGMREAIKENTTSLKALQQLQSKKTDLSGLPLNLYRRKDPFLKNHVRSKK